MRLTSTGIRRLMAHADPESVPGLQRFFKTGPGQYGGMPHDER
jgi:hypothetical protein